MRRNIVTNIEFSNDQIKMSVIEKLATNFVEIFSSSSFLSDLDSFLSVSLRKAENLISGSIKDVNVILEDSPKVGGSIKLKRTSLTLPNSNVSKENIEKLVASTQLKFDTDNTKSVILVQPLQFTLISSLENKVKKEYLCAPIGKVGEAISATFAITSISQKTKTSIENMLQKHKLSVSQIILKQQMLSQNNLSEHALVSGSSLIHIGETESFVTINKNSGTVASLSIYNFGYQILKEKIAKNFECSTKEAHKIIAIYGSFDECDETIVYSKIKNGKQIHYTAKHLQEIILAFTNKIVLVTKKFISDKSALDLPVVFSGRMTQINNLNSYIDNAYKNASIYEPMTFMEINSPNLASIGFMQWIERMNKIYSKKFDTIIETNPNILASLNIKKQSFWSKLAEKIGGRNEHRQ